jgi:phage shock protein C
MQNVNDQRFYRSKDRILGGVCAGLAEGFHVDPLWVRVAFLLLVFLQGVGLFLYIVLWLVMPERLDEGRQRNGFDAMTADLTRIWGEFRRDLGSTSQPTSSTPGPAAAAAPGPDPTPTSTAAAPPPSPSGGHAPGMWSSQSVVFGVILVVIGLALLGGNIGIINWSVVWPAAVITLGIVILVRNFERRP